MIETRIKELEAVEFLLTQSPQFKHADLLVQIQAQRAIDNIRRAVTELETLIKREKCPHNWLGGYCDLCGAVKGGES